MSLSKDDEQIDKRDAMFIVNHILDLSGADVATRQRINDECDDFVHAKLVEARIQENEWTSNELTKDVQLPIVPLRVHRLLNKRLAELQGLGEAKNNE